MKLKLAIIWRYFRGQNKVLRVTSFLASFGIIIGVACLVLVMSVVNGVHVFIRDSIIDLQGDISVVYRGPEFSQTDLDQKLKNLTSEYQSLTPFIQTQGVAVKKGKIFGVLLHGIEEESSKKVLKIQKRILTGKRDLSIAGDLAGSLVGKELAKRLSLSVGDELKVVIPRPTQEKAQSFSPIVQSLKVNGIVDFGKFEFNEQVIIVQDVVIQKLLEIEGAYAGAYLKFKDSEKVPTLTRGLGESLGEDFRLLDWWDFHKNFFSAVEMEKIVIFIVVLFIVIVASFNISSTLFVSVLRKFTDISILKTLGASQKFLVSLFMLQGFLLGVVSAFSGLIVGIFITLIAGNVKIFDVPGEIYKFDRIPIDIRLTDLCIIFFVTVLVCCVSSLMPALKGARLKPVEGLKYD